MTLTSAAVKLKKRAEAWKARRACPQLPALWYMTDEARVKDPAAVVASLPRGTAVILRHYGVAGRAALAHRLGALCRQRGLILLIADDWRLAAKVGADGVHLPEHRAQRGPSSGARLWRRQCGTLLTVTAHGANGLRTAERLGASAAVLSPVFATPSHPQRRVLGLTGAATLLRRVRIAVLALGGVRARTMNGLGHAGFCGVAGIGFAEKKI